MIPDRDVVTGPSRRVTLSAGVGRAGQYKWPFIRESLQQSFGSGADIFQAEYIVYRQVRQRAAVVQAMPHVERHGFAGGQKDRRLVHIVPETGDAHVREILVQAAPPIARAGQCEIAKDAVAWPHRSAKPLPGATVPQ